MLIVRLTGRTTTSSALFLEMGFGALVFLVEGFACFGGPLGFGIEGSYV